MPTGFDTLDIEGTVLLDALLAPSSVALVGASGRADTLPGRLLHYLVQGGFAGPIYPVNPRYSELGGQRCHPSLIAIGEPVELVLIMVPGGVAAEVIDECGEVGARVAVLFGSGFSETGDDGAVAEAELVTRARRAGVRLLGPNCQGVISGAAGLLASFTPAIGEGPPRPGPVAYVGQSGALGGSFLDKAKERRLPVGSWISTGNQADISAIELATTMMAAPDVQVVALYLEDVGDGTKFIELARRARENGKELVVVRSGFSEVGRRAIQSHTGAMVSPHRVFELVARAQGVYTATDIDEMLDLTVALLSSQRPKGRSVGIVSSSGGAGILVADQLSERGFTVPELDSALQDRLRSYVPSYGSTQNPVDVTAQLFTSKGDDDSFGPSFRALCEHVGSSEGIDTLVIVLTMLVGAPGLEMAEALDGLQEQLGKPVVVVWLASMASSELGRARLAQEHVPVFDNVPSLANTMKALVAHQAVIPSPPEVSAVTEWVDRSLLGADELSAVTDDPAAGLHLLDRWGITQPKWAVATDAETAKRAAIELDGPVAVKLLAKGLAHKTELGAVQLHVEIDDVVDTCSMMRSRLDKAGGGDSLQGFLLQRMSAPGLELLLSVRREAPTFPPVLTVGFGGVTAELYADLASVPLPLPAGGAERLLQRLKGAPLLGSFRGGPPSDIKTLVDTIEKLAEAYLAAEGIVEEIEINPVIVHERGAGVSAVDCLVVWKSPNTPARPRRNG